MGQLEEQVERAKELLADIHHIAISTVNPDGTPHCSPVFMVFDDQLNTYWISQTDSQHSQNIQAGGDVFLVVFDSRQGKGGLYIRGKAYVLESAQQAELAHAKLKQQSDRVGGLDDYLGESLQRIYCATPDTLWVNQSEQNAAGVIVSDSRFEIPLSLLTGKDVE